MPRKEAKSAIAIAKQTKPDGMSDEDFARKVNEEKIAAQNSCDFLETSGFNAIAAETDPKARMSEIEKFTAASRTPNLANRSRTMRCTR